MTNTVKFEVNIAKIVREAKAKGFSKDDITKQISEKLEKMEKNLRELWHPELYFVTGETEIAEIINKEFEELMETTK